MIDETFTDIFNVGWKCPLCSPASLRVIVKIDRETKTFQCAHWKITGEQTGHVTHPFQQLKELLACG